MLRFLILLVSLIGGSSLLLYLGLPPIVLVAYVAGLLLLGAATGFSTGNRNGEGSSTSSSRSSGSILSSAAEAGAGLLDGLTGNGENIGGGGSTGSISRSGNPEDRRNIGEFGGTRDNGIESSSIDMRGGNWEVFLRLIEEANIERRFKQELLEVLQDNVDWQRKYNISIATMSELRQLVKRLDKSQLPEAAQKLANIFRSKNHTISEEAFLQFIDLLYREFGISKDYLRNKPNKGSMANNVSDRIQEIEEKVKNQEKAERHVLKLDEKAMEDLEEALKLYDKEEDFIHAVRQISTNLEKNSIADVSQQLVELREKHGVDLHNEEYVKEQIEAFNDMIEDLEDAIKSLKEADHELKQVESEDIDLEEALSTIEEREINMVKSARTVLKQVHDLE
ncbi:MAG: hypothetical protein ABEJ93_01660 [Candidatus Nanohalobium sp.]